MSELKSSQYLLVSIQGVTNMTTIRDLYEWAIKDGVVDLPIGLQFQNEEESFCGNTFTKFPDYRISAFVKEYFGEKYILLE